jgi:probable rRNA maturation factor
MLVDCLTEDHRWDGLGLAALAETAAAAALVRLGLEPSGYEISLLGCNDKRIAELNADFRGKPQPTNVLSWPSEERSPANPGEMPHLPGVGPDGLTELGDIALAWETCAAEAQAAGRPMADHVTHLVIHGTLHLLGFDHDHESDALLMEGIETDVMAELGLPDPYEAGPDSDSAGA